MGRSLDGQTAAVSYQLPATSSQLPASFDANVDPTSTDPWPQAEEVMLGSNEPRPTMPFNGYAVEVAGLYR